LAAGGIDEDAEGERQVRFGGEVFDGLRLAVLKNREVAFGTTLTLTLRVSAGC
jgi:hypothetical protein